MSEWQPISTAPKDGSFFLGFFMNGEQHVVAIDDAGDCYRDLDYDTLAMPTHWMPLPDPPTVDPPTETGQ